MLAIEPAGGNDSTWYLQNMWMSCQQSPLDRAIVLRDDTLAMLEACQATVYAEALDDRLPEVVPVVRSEVALRQMDRITKGKPPVFVEHLVADLYLFYALDLPTGMQFLTKAQVDHLPLQGDALRAESVKNLTARIPEIELHGEGPTFMIVAGGCYESSLLLLDELWSDIAPHVTGEVVACAPARDLLLVTGTASVDGLASVKNVAERAVTSGDHPLSSTLLQRHAGKWWPLPSRK